MSVPEATGADPRFPTRDWDAALAEVNAAQGFEPVGADGEPALEQPREESEPGREASQTAEAGQETPPIEPTTTAAPADDTATISRRELDELRRAVGQYGQNLQQQRQEFDQRVQQALAGQGPDIERRIADAAREARREAIRDLIKDVQDPGARQQEAARYQEQWNREDAQIASERQVAEANQIKTQAQQQIGQAQQVVNYAQAQMVAQGMPDYLAQYSPTIAQKAGRLLGAEVAPEEIQAFVTRPEIVELAAQAAYQGPQAVNQFGEMLTAQAAIHVRDQRAARAQSAQARREQVDASGLGREQAGGNGGRTPADINQYKSTPEKPGNWEGMLAALSERQGIRREAR